MSDAQQTIAAVLAAHWWFSSRDGEAGCNCNWRDGVDMTREQWAAHVAAEVDAALGTLTREEQWTPIQADGGRWEPREKPLALAALALYGKRGLLHFPDTVPVTRVEHETRWVSGWTPQDGE